MQNPIHFLPIVTTVVAIPFGIKLFRHWRRKPDSMYLLWWMIGVLTYAVGTFTESMTSLLGWNPVVFRAWYISGALLGGAPLAQGTVYLLMRRRIADRMTIAICSFITVAAVFVLLSPLDTSLVETYRLSGRVLNWQWVRFFSPFINTYAVIFLVGGAILSAWRYARVDRAYSRRMWGNIFIAVGAVLPGIGGGSARAGYVEVLYVTELLGLALIWLGYRTIVGDVSRSIHANQARDGQTVAQTST